MAFDQFIVPRPIETYKEEESILFRYPLKPYRIQREGKNLLCRLEKWGVIEYDYTTDQFSALVDRGESDPLPRAPLGVYWLVTAPCNLRCIHCYGNVEELPREKLDVKQQEFIAQRIIDSGAMRVTLNGGEPLLRKDTPQIIEQLADNHISVILGTNGTYLNKSILSSVRRTSLVEISFDSHDVAINNSIRISRTANGSAYHESLRAIELCAENDIKFRVLTCINQRNIHHVEAMADFLYARGARDWSISWTLFAGRARFVYENLVSDDSASVISALERVQEKYPDLKTKFSNRSNSADNNRYSCLVFPNGRMFAEDLSLGKKIPFHSLFDGPLTNSWSEENYNIKKHFERWTAGRIKQF